MFAVIPQPGDFILHIGNVTQRAENVIPRLDRGIHFGPGKPKMSYQHSIKTQTDHHHDPAVLSVIPRFNRGIQDQRG